jgi:hypothetical protein
MRKINSYYSRPAENLDHSLRCVFRQLVNADRASVKQYAAFVRWIADNGGYPAAMEKLDAMVLPKEE